ncbi:hypothetical protein [Helicobacter sp. T3_23-1059]
MSAPAAMYLQKHSQRMLDFGKAQSNLTPHKGILSYDLHDEKQVYPPHNKNLCKNFRG